MSEMTEAEQRAVWIGERLFPLRVTHRNQKRTFYKWLSSINGVHAVKTAMIARGYDVFIHYCAREGQWEYAFVNPAGIYEQLDKTEATAVLMAAEKALRGEGDNG